MSWLRNLLSGRSARRSEKQTLNLRTTRFRQLLRSYGRIRQLEADAAEKQSGDFVLDRQYVISLCEVLWTLTESVVFDLNVITGERHAAFYERLAAIRGELRAILAAGDTAPVEEAPPTAADVRDPATIADALAKGIARANVLWRGDGSVICRGLAAGKVFNLDQEKDLHRLPPKAVLVASGINVDESSRSVLDRAAAVILGSSRLAPGAATQVRSLRIPMIAGVGDATARMPTGIDVTVDADESTIYEGRIQELITYYETERLGPEEEPEYRLLRAIRQAVFPLTIVDNGERVEDPSACRTIHDVVHVAHLLAGEEVRAVLQLALSGGTAAMAAAAAGSLGARVVDLGDGAPANRTSPDAATSTTASLRPVRAFMAGMEAVPSRAAGVEVGPGAVGAVVKEECVNIVSDLHGSFDMVDSVLGDSRESNHVYCRFASGASGAARGEVAQAVLSRLEFASARGACATAGWISGISGAEAEERVKLVGSLSAYLQTLDPTSEYSQRAEQIAERFMSQHA